MRNKGRKARQGSRTQTVPHSPSLNKSTLRSSTDDPTVKAPKRTVEVDFCELADGTLVEMIENPNDATRTCLAIWKNGKVHYSEKLKCRDRVLVPVPKDTDIIRHVRLAQGTEDYADFHHLFGEILVFLNYCLELTNDQLILLPCFVLSTWLVEKLPIAPYLAFVGPPGSGKTTALRILSLICYRSLLTADISSAAFYQLCDRITTTLLIDEAATVNNRRQLFHLLRSGTTQGFVSVRKGKTYKSYGARVVSWLELPEDEALNSRCILVPIKSCSRTDLIAPTDPRVLASAARLQQMLLQFRFMSYKKLTLPKISGEEELPPRTRDLFRALALPLGEERVVCDLLLKFFKKQESLRDLLSVYQIAVLDSLYDIIHTYPEINNVKLSTLTEQVNANLQWRGESGNLSEKRVGDLLTSLHLTGRKRTNAGYILWLDRATREEIHSMVRKYKINEGPTPQTSQQCELCQALSQHPESSSTTNPITQSADAKANDRGERGELGERGKRKKKRKWAR